MRAVVRCGGAKSGSAHTPAPGRPVGSRARGNADPESDIALMVAQPSKEGPALAMIAPT